MIKKHLLIITVLLIISLNTSNAFCLNDAMGYYNLNNNINDSSGNDQENNGTISYNVSSECVRGTCGYFGNNDYVNVDTLSLDRNISICGWYYLNTYNSNQVLFHTDVCGDGLSFYIKQSSNKYAFGKCGVNEVLTSAITINVDEWYHFCAVYNNTVLRMYHNGSHLSDTAYSSDFSADKEYLIGHNQGSGFLAGVIDEFVLYDRALSGDEVSDLYNDGDGFNPYGNHPIISSPHPNNHAINTYGNIIINNDLGNTTTASCELYLNGSKYLPTHTVYNNTPSSFQFINYDENYDYDTKTLIYNSVVLPDSVFDNVSSTYLILNSGTSHKTRVTYDNYGNQNNNVKYRVNVAYAGYGSYVNITCLNHTSGQFIEFTGSYIQSTRNEEREIPYDCVSDYEQDISFQFHYYGAGAGNNYLIFNDFGLLWDYNISNGYDFNYYYECLVGDETAISETKNISIDDNEPFVNVTNINIDNTSIIDGLNYDEWNIYVYDAESLLNNVTIIITGVNDGLDYYNNIIDLDYNMTYYFTDFINFTTYDFNQDYIISVMAIDLANNQYVRNLSFSFYSNITILLRFYDEITRSSIIGVNVTLIGNGTTYNYDSGADNEINVSGFIAGDYMFQYFKSGYSKRDYYLTVEQNRIYISNLYLINNSYYENITIKVLDSFEKPLSNYYVRLRRYYPDSNEYVTVETVKTDYFGEEIVNAELYDVYYIVSILDEDYKTYLTTNRFQFKKTTMEFVLGSINNINSRYEKTDDVIHYMEYDNNTGNMIFFFDDTSNVVSSGCLNIYEEKLNKRTLITQSCVSTSSGIITHNISTPTTTTYYAEGIVYQSPTYVVLEQELFTLNESSQVSFGTEGLIFVFIIIIIFSFIAIYDVSLMLIMQGLAITVTRLIGLHTIEYGYIIGIDILLIIIGIVIYKFKD